MSFIKVTECGGGVKVGVERDKAMGLHILPKIRIGWIQEGTMPRISRLDRSEVSADLAALFDKAYALRGNVPNMFRVMAHRPEIFATMQAHFAAVLNTGTVSTRLKELIIVRTSQVNDTPYCLASHTILARNGMDRRPA